MWDVVYDVGRWVALSRDPSWSWSRVFVARCGRI